MNVSASKKEISPIALCLVFIFSFHVSGAHAQDAFLTTNIEAPLPEKTTDQTTSTAPAVETEPALTPTTQFLGGTTLAPTTTKPTRPEGPVIRGGETVTTSDLNVSWAAVPQAVSYRWRVRNNGVWSAWQETEKNEAPVGEDLLTYEGSSSFALQWKNSSGKYSLPSYHNFKVDHTPPGLTSVLPHDLRIINGSTSLTLQTNEKATVSVRYGTRPDQLTEQAESETFAGYHRLTISNLSPEQTVYYEITITDKAGQKTTLPVADFKAVNRLNKKVPPVVLAQTLTLGEDSVVNLTLTGTDANRDPLTFEVVAGPEHGTLEKNADGTWKYMPAANFNGTDTFTYRAFDGTFYSQTAVYTLTVQAVNDVPVALSGSATTLQGSFPAGTDVDGDPLTYHLVNGPAGFTLNADGTYLFTPGTDFNGTATVQYKINDGTSDSEIASMQFRIPLQNAVYLDPKTIDTSKPYYLDRPGTRYILTDDIAFEGTGFAIIAKDITLDLNGHTVTYGNAAPIRVPNGSFENGIGDWDFSAAPNLIVQPGTFVQPKTVHDGNYAAKFTGPAPDQSIVSAPITFQPNTTYSISYMTWGENVSVTLGLEGTDIQKTANAGNSRGFVYRNLTFTTGDQPETHRLVLSLTGATAEESYVYLDNVRVTVLGAVGVAIAPRSYYADTKYPALTRFGAADNARVINGNIFQGQDAGDFGTAVLVESTPNVILKNLHIKVSGADSEGIHAVGSNHQILNNTIESTSTVVKSRDSQGSELIYIQGTGAKILNNTLRGGPQSGIVLMGATDTEVSGNDIRLSTRYTNGFAIQVWNAANIKITGNTINCTEEYACRGIYTGGGTVGVQILENQVQVQLFPNNQEYNGCVLSGAYGIQVERGTNVEIGGNNVTAFAGACEGSAFRLNPAPDSDIHAYNNVFTGVRVGETTNQVSAIYLSAIEEPNHILIEKNTIITDDRWVSTSSGVHGGVIFDSNTFGIGTNPVAEMKPFTADNWRDNGDYSANLTFRNNYYLSAAAEDLFKRSVITRARSGKPDPYSTLTIL